MTFALPRAVSIIMETYKQNNRATPEYERRAGRQDVVKSQLARAGLTGDEGDKLDDYIRVSGEEERQLAALKAKVDLADSLGPTYIRCQNLVSDIDAIGGIPHAQIVVFNRQFEDAGKSVNAAIKLLGPIEDYVQGKKREQNGHETPAREEPSSLQDVGERSPSPPPSRRQAIVHERAAGRASVASVY